MSLDTTSMVNMSMTLKYLVHKCTFQHEKSSESGNLLFVVLISSQYIKRTRIHSVDYTSLFVIVVNYRYRLVLAGCLDFAVLFSASRLGVLCFLLVVFFFILLLLAFAVLASFLGSSGVLLVLGQLSRFFFLLALIITLIFAFGLGGALGLFLWR